MLDDAGTSKGGKLDARTMPETTAVADGGDPVNGPQGRSLDWDAVRWRPVEEQVRQLRQRIFAASQAGDLKKVCSAPGLMETSKTLEDDPYGRTTEVPRRTARTRHPGAIDARKDPETRAGAYKRVADQLGVHPEALRTWVKRAAIDEGLRPGTTTDDASRLAELERELKELRRANAILKQASTLFASMPS